MICFLCTDTEPNPGFWVVCISNFVTDGDRQFANKQREEANEPGCWFTAESVTDKPFQITTLPYKLFD